MQVGEVIAKQQDRLIYIYIYINTDMALGAQHPCQLTITIWQAIVELEGGRMVWTAQEGEPNAVGDSSSVATMPQCNIVLGE